MPELTLAEVTALLDVLSEHPDADDPWSLYPVDVADAVWSGRQKLRAAQAQAAAA